MQCIVFHFLQFYDDPFKVISLLNVLTEEEQSIAYGYQYLHFFNAGYVKSQLTQNIEMCSLDLTNSF